MAESTPERKFIVIVNYAAPDLACRVSMNVLAKDPVVAIARVCTQFHFEQRWISACESKLFIEKGGSD